MIPGRVTANRVAIVGRQMAGPVREFRFLAAVAETGKGGYPTQPRHLTPALPLPFAGYHRGALVEGAGSLLDAYLAAVVWLGKRRDVVVSQTQGEPLAGMSVLQGSRLTIEVRAHGEVVIAKRA